MPYIFASPVTSSDAGKAGESQEVWVDSIVSKGVGSSKVSSAVRNDDPQ